MIDPPKKILLGLQEGSCNLACPKCYTHGQNSPTSIERSGGVMDFSSFVELVEEIAPFEPRIAPQTWDEPLLTPDFFKYLKVLKDHNLVVTMDTNGILLSESIASLLIELGIDSVFISIDATTSFTYKKVRGRDKFDLVLKNVEKFLELRGERTYPRIGVSFVSENGNEAEKDDFVEFWQDRVDVVRVNKIFTDERKVEGNTDEANRTVCWSLYDSLMISANGKASLCCVDTHNEIELGNVFTSGVQEVWNSDQFNAVRESHKQKEFGKIAKICESCNLWSNEKAKVTQTKDLVIAQTHTHTYFNNINKLESISKTNRYVNG